jgi:hypothetical protein
METLATGSFRAGDTSIFRIATISSLQSERTGAPARAP